MLQHKTNYENSDSSILLPFVRDKRELSHVVPYHMTINLIIKNLIVCYQIYLMARPVHVHIDRQKKGFQHSIIERLINRWLICSPPQPPSSSRDIRCVLMG